MVMDDFPKAVDTFRVVGCTAYFGGNEGCLQFCPPALIDHRGNFFVALKHNWEASPGPSHYMEAVSCRDIGAAVPLNPRAILPGQNVAVVGPDLLTIIQSLNPEQSSVLFDSAFEFPAHLKELGFKAHLVTFETFNQLVHDVIGVGLVAFDEEFPEGMRELTTRARLSLDLFRATTYDPLTRQGKEDVSAMAQRLWLADSVDRGQDYGLLADYYDKETSVEPVSGDFVIYDLKT